MGNSFSITGAVVGGVGTAAILLGLGAFFDAQERKRKEKALPPEMRAVFNRMFGKDTSPRQQHCKPAPRPQMQRHVPLPPKSSANPQDMYSSITSGLIAAINAR